MNRRHRPRRLLCLLLACALFGLRLQAQAGPGAAAAMLQQGQTAMQHGDLAGAQASFQRATAAAPNFAPAFLALGLTQLRTGAADAAIASLTRASKLDPRLGGAHLFLGIAQYQVGQSDAALRSLHAELALDPNSVETLTWLTLVSLGTDRPEQAIAPIDRAVQLKGDDPQLLYYQARAHALVAQTALRSLETLGPDSALLHRAKAEDLADSGQPEKAIAEFQLALHQQPDNPDLLEALGDQEQKLSRFAEARGAYEHELALNPHSAIALYNLGKIAVEQGKPEEGVALLQKAVAAHASPAPADYYLGFGLEQLGQTAEAAHWLEQSLASQPSPFIEQSACFQLARVYQRLNRKEEAQRLLARLQQLKAQAAPEAQASADAAAPSH